MTTPTFPSISSSVLWEILEHTSHRTFASFALCCHGTLHLSKPDLPNRYRDWQIPRNVREIWKNSFTFGNAPPWPPPREQIYENNIFLCVLATSDGLLRWVLEKWPRTEYETHKNNYMLLRCVAGSGNLASMQWLVEKWPPVDWEIYRGYYWLLRRAAVSGNLAMVQWMVKKWPPPLCVFTNTAWTHSITLISPIESVRVFLEKVRSYWDSPYQSLSYSAFIEQCINSSNTVNTTPDATAAQHNHV